MATIPNPEPAEIEEVIDRIHLLRSEKKWCNNESDYIWILAVEELWAMGFASPSLARLVFDRCVIRFGRAPVASGHEGEDPLATPLLMSLVEWQRDVAIEWMREHGDSYFVISVPEDFNMAAAQEGMKKMILEAIEEDLHRMEREKKENS